MFKRSSLIKNTLQIYNNTSAITTILYRQLSYWNGHHDMRPSQHV